MSLIGYYWIVRTEGGFGLWLILRLEHFGFDARSKKKSEGEGASTVSGDFWYLSVLGWVSFRSKSGFCEDLGWKFGLKRQFCERDLA